MEHSVLNCSCGLIPEDGFIRKDPQKIDFKGLSYLDKAEFFEPEKGTDYHTMMVFDKKGRMEGIAIPNTPGEHRDIHCYECKDMLKPGDEVDRIHIATREHYFAEIITCAACAAVRDDFIGEDGFILGKLREQIYVCLGFDYLGDENWEPDFENLSDDLKALYARTERIREGAK